MSNTYQPRNDVFTGGFDDSMERVKELNARIQFLEALHNDLIKYPERMTLEAALEYAYNRTCSFEVYLTNDGICRHVCGKPLNPGSRNSFCDRHADFWEE